MRVIAGKYRGKRLSAPKGDNVRPTTDRIKETVFNILQFKIAGARCLDLFAGTGNLGLESWSRGAEGITFIDESKESLRLVQANITKCKADKDCTVIKGNAVNVIERLYKQGKTFDFAFCDPPYNKGWIAKIITALNTYPVLNHGGYLVVERAVHEVLEDMPAAFELVRSEKYGETIVDFVYYNRENIAQD